MSSAKRILERVKDPNKFDLTVHEWNSQGAKIGENHYNAFIIQGLTYYERPVKSGNLWYENNQPAGRMEYTYGPNGAIATKELKVGEPHKQWTAPLEGEALVNYELEQTREKLAAAQAELAQIKVERDTKQAVAPAPKVSKQ